VKVGCFMDVRCLGVRDSPIGKTVLFVFMVIIDTKGNESG